jgi:hypothetical protein
MIRYFQSVPLDPFEPISVDLRETSVFFCDFGIELGQLNISICANENLDALLLTLAKRNMITRWDSRFLFGVGSFVTVLLLSSNPAVLSLVKFFLRNGMRGIQVKPSPYTARQKVSLHALFCNFVRSSHIAASDARCHHGYTTGSH